MDINKILRNTILVGIFVIPFLPLYVANSMFFPFITGKNFAFRIIVEVILALWVILALRDKSYAPAKSLVAYSVAAFLCIIAVADIFGANFFRSFWSNYERMEGLVGLLHLSGYFLVVGTVLNTDKLWDRYFKTIMGVGLLLFFYSCLQLAGFIGIDQGAVRTDATFGNATYLAVHMLFLMFIAVFYYFRTRESGLKWKGLKKKDLIYPLLAVLFFFTLYKTATRGALIGLFVGVLASGLALSYYGHKKAKKASIALLVTLALLLLAFIPLRNTSFVKSSETLSRFSQLNIDSITNEPRLMVWGMAFKGFLEHPILGWGQDNFNLVFNKYYNPGMFAQEPWFDRAHDVFFDWLTAGGILGLGAYLAMFGAALYAIWHKSGRLNFSLIDKAVFTGMLIAYFVQNIFVFDNLVSYTIFFTILAYLHYGSKEAVHQHKLAARQSEDMLFTQIVSSLVAIGFIASMYFLNIKPIFASQTLIGALASPDAKQSLQYFKDVFAYNTFGSGEAREQLAQKTVNIRQSDLDNDTKLQYFNLARDEMSKQIDMSPDDARYRIFMASLLSAYGLQDDALTQALKAVDLSPTKQMLLFELASIYVNRHEYDKALDTAKKAYDLDHDYTEAAKIYLTISIYAGKDSTPDFQALLTKIFKGGVADDDRFINAYAAVNRYDKVVEIWQARVAANPTNPQAHISLAASYLANKQRSKAIDELRVAIQLNPAFKDNGEHFISEIQAGRNP